MDVLFCDEHLQKSMSVTCIPYIYPSFLLMGQTLSQNILYVITRVPIWPVWVAVTAHMTSMRITVDTVFLLITAPVCTAAKYSVQDSTSAPTVKHGNTCCFSTCAFKKLLFLQKLIEPWCRGWIKGCHHSVFQCLWSGSVALQRRALLWEMSGLRQRTLPDIWLQLVPLWRTMSVHTSRGENKHWRWNSIFMCLSFVGL